MSIKHFATKQHNEIIITVIYLSCEVRSNDEDIDIDNIIVVPRSMDLREGK